MENLEIVILMEDMNVEVMENGARHVYLLIVIMVMFMIARQASASKKFVS